MRYAPIIGLTFLLVTGCADKPAPQDIARAGRAKPLANEEQSQPAAPNPPLPKLVSAEGKPIPQDEAKVEKRFRELLDWNRRTLGVAYDQIGKKDPKWDKSAREAMEAASRMFSRQYDPPVDFPDIYKPAKAAVDAGCDDPLLVYLYNRSSSAVRQTGLVEATRQIQDSAKALSISQYPVIRRAITFELAGTYALGGKHPSELEKKEAARAFNSSLDLLPLSVRTDERNEFWEERWFDSLASLISGYRKLGVAPMEAYEKIDAELAKVPELKVLRLKLRGNFLFDLGWEARTTAFAPAVPAGGFETLEKCLSKARIAFEEAWSLRPDDAGTATNLLAIDKAIGGDRATMELWFERAMDTDPDKYAACLAKLDWLDPKWHGDSQGREMLAFGRQCRDTKNWRAGITILCAEAHWRIACMPGGNQNTYLALPEVWADIESVYNEYFKHHPLDNVSRSKFATLCFLSTHFREAEVQYVALGDRLTQWTDFPYVPLGEMKKSRERNARVLLGKEGRTSFPGWHFLHGTNDAGEWHVNAPASLQKRMMPGTLGVDQSYTWNCSVAGITYMIRMQDIPESRRKDNPERILEADRSDLAKERGAEDRNLRNTLIAARPGQEYDVDLPGPQPMRMSVKTIIIGDGIYELSVKGSRNDVTSREAREFFDSFAFQTKTN